jgi:hypothetical protein
MSIYGISRLAWDLEHVDGLAARLKDDPHAVLADYPLTDSERDAVFCNDARWLLAHGVNPVVLRNLVVMQGVPHAKMYTQSTTD